MKIDNVTRRILAVGLSVTGILLAGSLFMNSISPAQADSPDNFNFESKYLTPPSGAGSIMMDYTSVHVPSQDKTYYEVMVWDTQTGRSKLYYYSYSDKKFVEYEDNVQLPARPLD